MIIAVYGLPDAMMTRLTRGQESILSVLLEDFKSDTEALMGKGGLMMEIKKRIAEVMLVRGMTSHPDNAHSDSAGNAFGNFRNRQ